MGDELTNRVTRSSSSSMSMRLTTTLQQPSSSSSQPDDLHHHHQHQVDSDFALALALQQQERASAPVSDDTLPTATVEISTDRSDDDDEDDDEDLSSSAAASDDDNEEEYDFDTFLQSQEDELLTEEQAELEGEDSNYDQEMEEDDIDPDELSYEELIALGEMVGEENRGLSMKEISSCLSPYSYAHSRPSVITKTIIDKCVICQVEYNEGGDTLVALPCEHPYHPDCISKWLQIKKICPICGSEVSSSSNVNAS